MKANMEQKEPSMLVAKYELFRDKERRWFWFMAVSVIASVISVILGPSLGLMGKVSVSLSGCAVIGSLVGMRINNARALRWYRVLLDRALQTPYGLWTAAKALYDDGKNLDWMVAAIECDEAHMPGDCPLCGAD